MDMPDIIQFFTWITISTILLLIGGTALVLIYRAAKELGSRGRPIGAQHVRPLLHLATKRHEDEESCKESRPYA